MKKEFKSLNDKIQSMTAKEIILTMVDSLRNPVTKIDMSTWGVKKEGICYGCAATNTICKIGGLDPSEVLSESVYITPDYSRGIVESFESAINALRKGDIFGYNAYASLNGFSQIYKYKHLPYLSGFYTEEKLKVYEDFANTL